MVCGLIRKDDFDLGSGKCGVILYLTLTGSALREAIAGRVADHPLSEKCANMSICFIRSKRIAQCRGIKDFSSKEEAQNCVTLDLKLHLLDSKHTCH